jgi:hypothetical protein
VGLSIVIVMFGLTSILIAIILVLFPGITTWLDEQTNLRKTRSWIQRGGDAGLAMRWYEANLKLLRYAFPAFFLAVGVLLIVKGVA